MYMARFRLSRHHDVRIQDSTGELMAHAEIHSAEGVIDVLHRLHLQPFGPRYGVTDDGAFMVAVEPVTKTLLSGLVVVGLDFFHRQVVLSIDDTNVRLDQLDARRIAKATMQAAAKAQDLWGGEPT